LEKRQHDNFCRVSGGRYIGKKAFGRSEKVRLFGEEISVEARIEMIEGFSGHADKEGF